jgi:predicted metal-dependent peptidase
MDKIQKARLLLGEKLPYLRGSRAIDRLVLIPSDKVPLMGCDQTWTVWYNPAWVEQAPIEQVVGVLHHELDHLLFGHHDRGPAYPGSQQAFTVGAELEINGPLQHEESLPEQGMFPQTFDLPEGLIAEQYAKLLEEQSQQDSGDSEQSDSSKGQDSSPEDDSSKGDPQGGDSAGQEGQGQEGQGQGQEGQGQGEGTEGEGQGQGKEGQAGKSGQGRGQNAEDGQGKGEGEGEGEGRGQGPQQPSCGSGAGDKPGEWEQDKDPENPGLSPLEVEALRKQAALAILEAKKSQGSVPGRYARLAEKVLAGHKVPWSQLLRRGLLGAMSPLGRGEERTYSRPHRRGAQMKPIVLPGTVQLKPMVAVIVDSSGSVGDKDLGIFLATAEQAIRESGGEAWVLVGDTESAPARVRSLKGIKPQGGGGTDMGALIALADSLKPHPDVIVCITDGYTPWGTKPKAELITVINNDLSTGPGYGKVIRI